MKLKFKAVCKMKRNEKFEAFTAVKIQVEFLWVVTPCNDVVGYQSFGGPCCRRLQDENGGNVAVRNGGILPQHYKASQPTRTLHGQGKHLLFGTRLSALVWYGENI
jgi:hypothetical protein